MKSTNFNKRVYDEIVMLVFCNVDADVNHSKAPFNYGFDAMFPQTYLLDVTLFYIKRRALSN
jgi:hypothetical protein